MLLKTKYQECWLEQDTLVFKWLAETSKMTDEEFFIEIEKAADIIKKQKKPKVLLLAKELYYLISLAIQQKVNQIFLPVYNDSGVKYLAIVLPKDMISLLAIEQTLEETRLIRKFEVRFFLEEKEAREWLYQDKGLFVE